LRWKPADPKKSGNPMARTGRTNGTRRRGRLSLVAAIVLAVGATFLYVGGWLSPRDLTPERFIDTFEQLNGAHPSFRRNHAKGVGVRGTFDSNGQGVRLSKAVVFRPGRVPVVGRFALAGGMPYQADALRTVRSMALQFSLPDGEEWRTGMNNTPVFAVNTPQAFHEQLLAMAPDAATGKPDPLKVKAFLDHHPESARAIQTIGAHPPSSGFDDAAYNSLNAFWLLDAAGRPTKVRWSMVPAQPLAGEAPPPQQGNPNFLFDALIARLHRAPLQWHLVLTIGQPGDPTNDATVAWPADREKLDVGTLTIDTIESEETSAATTVNFDPLILPDGIAGSDDPLLSARSAAYSVSFRRRVGEAVAPRAVTSAEVER
jgi:catalase